MQLHGFKSFADKTELEFVRGITAVVGPNGSGKSNISDSIRWVLGEQSARSLRGGTMQDIIFSGSDGRQAINFCEVSLTLDNTDHELPLDFSEVTVQRRLHRSGESEYFINKQACRLRDITELFMDTGIGKEAYSIIGQGRIEEILSTRSEDRRGIFEEASGIVKYKSRKQEAKKKLEETDHNLVRIHDLIAELEDQIEPLRAQSDKAIEYKKLTEQLAKIDISLYVHTIDQLHRVWVETNEAVERQQREQLALATAVQKQDALLEKDRVEARTLELALEQLQADLLQWSEEAEKAEGHSSVLKERQRSIRQQQEEKERQRQQLQGRVEQLEQEQHNVNEKKLAISESLQNLQQLQQESETRLLDVTALADGRSVEELKTELLETLNRCAQLRNEIRYTEQQLATYEQRSQKLTGELEQWKRKRSRLTSDQHQAEVKADEVKAAIELIRKQSEASSERLKEKQNLLDEVTLTTRKWQQKLDALASRRDTLKELLDDYDGFFHGVKEVLKHSTRSNGLIGVRGAIAELIRVPTKLETAIETALGNALQHIVMEDEASSRTAIQFLKSRQLGRATFLPLNVIRGRQIAPQDAQALSHQAGFIGIASDLIEYADEYQNIMSNLLGTVMIAENLQQANQLAALCKYRYRVVTMEGDVVHAGGSMTGGSLRRKGSSLLSRQRKVDELEQQVTEAQGQLAKLTGQMNLLKDELHEIHEAGDRRRQQAEQKRLEEQQFRSRIEQLTREISSIDHQMTISQQEHQELEDERALCLRQRTAFKQELTELTAEEDTMKEAIEREEQARLSHESEKEQLQAELTDFRVKQASLSQESQSLADEHVRISDELNDAKQSFQTLLDELHELSVALDHHEQEQIEQRKQLNEARIKREECAEAIDFKRAERTQRHRSLEQDEGQTKGQRDELKRVEQLLHETEVKANRLDVELENILKKLADEYELSYELAKERYPKLADVEEARRAVTQLKREITLLGDVNLGAIDEFKRIYDRFQFLEHQKDDLVEAKRTLLEVIKEVEAEMSSRFKQTFADIRGRFGSVFSRLFGGGRADLVLTDPENMLETGIDIVAQPPGKKLQNLQLLSGGERALTAIALLFAILHVKPVPFCVLDEVEAALDEANVIRFAQYLREFSGDTQFIVVTHRKGTMEEADVLYGVAMEDDGVSKLVSVKLEDDESVSA